MPRQVCLATGQFPVAPGWVTLAPGWNFLLMLFLNVFTFFGMFQVWLHQSATLYFMSPAQQCKTIGPLTLAFAEQCAPCKYLSLYIPCLVRVRPHGIFTRQCTCAIHVWHCVLLYFCTIVCLYLYVLHKTSGIASSKVSVSSLIQVLCTVSSFIAMVQPLYCISNQCRIIVLKFIVNYG